MASEIIGNALNATEAGSIPTKKVLQRRNFNKEPNGLETIIDTYAFRTDYRQYIVPDKGARHSYVTTGNETKYDRMVVESVATEEQDGGITQMQVTFVGLTSSYGLPPPIIRLIPTAGEGVYGPPLVIEAEYVTDVNETQFMASQLSQNNALQPATVFSPTIKMPEYINGYAMPKSPKPDSLQAGAGAVAYYTGYCVLSMSCERRGDFLVARNTYHEVLQTAIIR